MERFAPHGESADLAARVLEYSRDAIIVTDAKARIERVNRAFTELTGYTRREAVGRTPALLRSGLHDRAFYRRLLEELRERDVWRGEIWHRRKNGELFLQWLSVSAIRDDAGMVTHYVGIFSDATERKRAQQELEYLAHHDALTGLPNRVLLNDRLNRALASARRRDERLAVMFTDLDGFKSINDTLGHAAGDTVLRAAALRLLRCVRESDTVARLGGDEFVVILKELDDAAEAAAVARKILSRLARPFSVANSNVFITASIGIAMYPEHDMDPAQLLKKADSAMYRVKAAAKNGFLFYDPPRSH